MELDNYSLQHFGILGQKWGIRRFQNADGSLTEAGKERYGQPRTKEEAKKLYQNPDGSLTEEGKKALSEYRKKYVSTYPKSSSLTSDDKRVSSRGVSRLSDTDDIIKKGSKVDRLAFVDNDKAKTGEPIDEQRKYVSITDKDQMVYRDMWEYFIPTDADLGKVSPVIDVYEFTKDARVANGKKVVEDFVEQYGDQKTKDFLADAYKDASTREGLVKADKKASAGEKWLAEQEELINRTLSSDLNKVMYRDIEEGEKFFKQFKDQGYDAIVDAEDWFGFGEVEYPLIVLNPQDSMKKVETREF